MKIDFKENVYYGEEYDFDSILKNVLGLSSDMSVAVNFDGINRIDGGDIFLLLYIVTSIYNKTKKRTQFLALSEPVLKYLKDVELFNLNYVVAKDFGVWRKSQLKDVLIPVTLVKDNSKLVDIVSEYKTRAMQTDISIELKNVISNIIFEMGANVPEHAFSNEPEYIYYLFVVINTNTVRIVIQDCGKGFYRSLHDTYPDIENSQEALEKVVIEHWSTRGTHNEGGMGYRYITKMVNMFSGKLTILTGEAIINYSNNRNYSIIEKPYNIKGSNILIELGLNEKDNSRKNT